jgi:hypothetical protein
MADAKLTSGQREEIKSKFNLGMSAKDLCVAYNVSLALIYRIGTNKRYHYSGPGSNTGNCLFCFASLSDKRPQAKFCDGNCKANFHRLGSGGDLKITRIRKPKLIKAPRVYNSYISDLKSAVPKEEWLTKKWGSLVLVDSPDLPRAWCPNSNHKFLFRCDCGNTTYTQMDKVNKGHTHSCGCGSFKSSWAEEFYSDIKKIFPDAVYSVRGLIPEDPRLEMDVWISSMNLAIEYHGLYWHSDACEVKNSRSDFKKFMHCWHTGIRLIQIYSDDWRDRRPIFEDFLYRIKDHKYGKRVYGLEPKEISTQEAEDFLNKNHYLSGTNISSSLCVGLLKNNELYAASVFKRRNDTEYEWLRHSFKLGYRSWNPAGQILDFAKSRVGKCFIISFSDNRIHTGKMYASLGFQYEGFTGQSYEYTDCHIRKHKFNFRVPAGVNEQEEAAKQGFYRVYDSCKSRWVLPVNGIV